MKKLVTVIIIMVAATVIIQSCKKNSSTADFNADKTQLSIQIDSATALYNSSTEGKQAGQYSVGSKEALDSVITLALGVKNGTTFTQQQVNNATANLERAEATFKTKLIQQVSAANLVAYWKFTGNANDSSGNGHNGTLQTNYVGTSAATAVDGNTLPVLTTDRYGNANSAYYFNNGAYIEIPYDASLHPSNFTITCWVKPTVASAGNYIFSVDHYYGYKFQLQNNNFPFLTVSTDQGIFDTDDSPGIGPYNGTVQLNTWMQIAASYTSGSEKFYINGVLQKDAVVNGNLAPLKTIVNACIGNELPKSAYNFTDTTNPDYFYGASYFQGSIDDVRLYNIVLSDSQVGSLYVMESPN